MVDLLQADWGTGARPYEFWTRASVDDQLAFAHSWPLDPVSHFNKFRSVGTQGVLEILYEVAERRTTLAAGPPWTSQPIDAALWNDTLSIVTQSPFHCGGWLGLLTIVNDPSRRSSRLDRPDPTGPLHYITWPPSGSRGLVATILWMMQRFRRSSLDLATGESWSENEDMGHFVDGQFKTGGGYTSRHVAREGYESFADTVLGLVYEYASEDTLHRYLRALRGHGPVETGRSHYLDRAVSRTDADSVGIRETCEHALNRVLMGFPAAWSHTTVADWDRVVALHVENWRIGIGNHRAGMTWLEEAVQRRIDHWNDATIVDQVFGARTTQRTVGTTITETLRSSVTEMESIRRSIGTAHRIQTTESWTRELERALERVESWSRTTRGGTSSTRGGTFGNETSVTAGGETGALEEFLIGKLTGEVSTTIQTQLQSQFTSHLEHERTTSDTERTSEAERRRQTRTMMRERSYHLTEEATQSITRTIERGVSLSRSVQAVEDIDAGRTQQVGRVRNGLTIAMASIQTSLARL